VFRKGPSNVVVLFSFDVVLFILNFLYLLCIGGFCRHEAELAAADSQPLPDDDDDTFE